jgi:MMPL family
MNQPQTQVLPLASPAGHDQHSRDRHRRARAPMVERIAGWSARHRKTAVFGWLALVAVVFVGGQALGTKSQPAYDAGQAGQAERTLHGLGVVAPAVEDVLIQARSPGHTFATDPEMRQAARQVVSVLARLPGAATDIRSPRVSADGHSALVTFNVPGPADGQVTAVAPALNAVAAVQARYPGLRIAEGGDASFGRAINAVLDSGFRKAEATSVPITLILLLLVFGALIALHPGHAADRRHQDARRGPGRRGAHRRDRGPRDPAARGHVPAGGAVLVPATLAVMAPRRGSRAQRPQLSRWPRR